MKTDNELIAEFMGIRVRYQGPVLYHCDEDGMIDWVDGADTYSPHLDWSDLMRVVEKIELIPVSDDTFVRVDITTKRCRISGNPFEVVGWQMIVSESDGKTKIEATYQAVVKFIRFYNTEIKERKFYCADWDRCGSICEEQCVACKKTNNL